MTSEHTRAMVEALLFASSKPLSVDNISEVSGMGKAELKEIISFLQEEYSSEKRGFTLEMVAGGYQLRSDPRFSPQIGKMFASRSRRRLTRSSLESLSIIAYRQPVTRAEIEHIRGVDSGAVIKTLLSLSMIRILGRKEGPGRPILYGTTREFLEYFGLRDIESLPTLEEVTELLEEGEAGTLDAETQGYGDAEIPESDEEPLDTETRGSADANAFRPAMADEHGDTEREGEVEEDLDESTST